MPALYSYHAAIVAGLLLYIPAWILRRVPLARYGFTHRPLGKNLLLFLLAVAVVFPIFFGGFAAWQKIACAARPLRGLVAACPPSLWAHFRPRLPADPVEDAAHQLLVVALPEEFFFRGWLQGRLAEVWRSRAGTIAVASALFALCHLAVQWDPATLAVFFPGLVFGWMRARTGSILPGTLFHAACNLYIGALLRSFYG